MTTFYSSTYTYTASTRTYEFRVKTDYTLTYTDTTCAISFTSTLQMKGNNTGQIFFYPVSYKGQYGTGWKSNSTAGTPSNFFNHSYTNTYYTAKVDQANTWQTAKILDSSSNEYPASFSGSKTVNRTTTAQAMYLCSDLVMYACLSTESPLTNKLTFSNLYADITISAKPSYAVTYNANGGSGTTASQTKWYGTALTLSQNSFTRSGYSFKRWNTSTNDTGTAYNAGASYTGNAALSLYAIWNRTVTYNANGGTGAPAAQTAIATSAITLSSTVPTKAGSTFRGWATSSTATSASYQAGGTYEANSPSVTLYAVWWANPSITTPTVTRCDSSGTADACGGYVKVSVPWSITASQVGETQTGLTAFSITVAGNSQTFSDSTVPTGTSGTQVVILGDGTLNPNKAYTVTVTATDNHGTTTNVSTLAADSGYTLPALANVTTVLSDSSGNSDILGKYVHVTTAYSVYATDSQTAASALSASITHNASDTEEKSDLSASGTATWTFGPYDYDDIDPHGGYTVGTISLSDGFNTTTLGLALASTGYAKPSITSISAYRTEAVVDGGTTTYEEADDGTCLGIDLEWAIAQTPSQTDPSSVTVVVKDLDAADAAHETVAVREFEPTGTSAILNVYPDAIEWPDDVVIGGELINTAHRYAVEVTLSDLYSDEVASAKATRSELITVAYFTMDFLAGGHGIAMGKPSTTAELLDVGYGASFDGDVDASGDIKSDGEVTATDANDVLHNLTEKIDAADVENGYLPLTGGTLTGTLVADGGIDMNGQKRIYWKESGYGDKFAIVPSFSGADDANLLKIQSAVGTADTDPELSDKVTISGSSGNVWMNGGLTVGSTAKFGAQVINVVNGQRGTTPSANQYRTYEFQDTEGRRLAQAESGLLTDGKSVMNLWVLGHYTSANDYGGIQIYKTKDNTGNYSAQFNANTGRFYTKTIETPDRAVSYVAGAQGDAAIYARKAYNQDHWYPAVCLETKGGGSWQMGNYNSEQLELVYATKAYRDASNNNIPGHIYLSAPPAARNWYVARIIYDNNSGSTGNITVAETFANFAFAFIGFKENDGYYDGLFVRSPNGKTVVLHTAESTVNGANNSKWQTRSLSGTACNVVHYADGTSATNHIYVTHIIGFA